MECNTIRHKAQTWNVVSQHHQKNSVNCLNQSLCPRDDVGSSASFKFHMKSSIRTLKRSCQFSWSLWPGALAASLISFHKPTEHVCKGRMFLYREIQTRHKSNVSENFLVVFVAYESQLLKSSWWRSDTSEMAAEIWVAVYYCLFLVFFFKYGRGLILKLISFCYSHCVNPAGKSLQEWM